MAAARTAAGLVAAAALAASLVGTAPWAGAAPTTDPACYQPPSLEVTDLPGEEPGVQIVRDVCGVPVRAIGFVEMNSVLPPGPFPAQVRHDYLWICTDPASTQSEATQFEPVIGFELSVGKGWQYRGDDGRWHTAPGFEFRHPEQHRIAAKPWNNDECFANGDRSDGFGANRDPDFVLPPATN